MDSVRAVSIRDVNDARVMVSKRTSAFERLPSSGVSMRWVVTVLLLSMWTFGFVSSYTLGGFIHLLLILALAALLAPVIRSRRPM